MLFRKRKTDQTLKTMPRATIDRRRSGPRVPRSKASGRGRSRRAGVFVYGFLWLAFIGTAVYLLVFSVFLAVETVRVETTGPSTVRDAVEAQVRSVIDEPRFGVFPGRNLLLLSPNALTRGVIAAFPEVARAEVERVFPHAIIVSIIPREAVLRWCSGGPCFLVDEDGAVFASDERLLPDSPLRVVTVVDESGEGVRQGGDQAVDRDLVKLATSVGPALEEALSLRTEGEYRVAAREASELKLRTAEGWELLLDTRAPLETVVGHLRLFLDKQVPPESRSALEYVDLRIRNRVYYRMKGAAEAASVPSGEASAPEAKKKEDQPDQKKEKDN